MGRGYQGYFSDLTRTFALEWWKMNTADHQLVLEANTPGGLPVSGHPRRDVDRAARCDHRAVWRRFLPPHRSRLGWKSMEPPYMFAETTSFLAPGMTSLPSSREFICPGAGDAIGGYIVVTARCESLKQPARANCLRVG